MNVLSNREKIRWLNPRANRWRRKFTAAQGIGSMILAHSLNASTIKETRMHCMQLTTYLFLEGNAIGMLTRSWIFLEHYACLAHIHHSCTASQYSHQSCLNRFRSKHNSNWKMLYLWNGIKDSFSDVKCVGFIVIHDQHEKIIAVNLTAINVWLKSRDTHSMF